MSYNPEGGPTPGYGQGQEAQGQPGGWGPPGGDAQPPAPNYPAPPAPGYGPGPQPGYGPAGYPAPYYGPPIVARKTNGMAVTGMVLGIIGLVLFWAGFFGVILDVLGIIFSSVGISQTGRTGQDGKGMAIAGLVCSLVSVGLWVLVVIAIESAVHSF